MRFSNDTVYNLRLELNIKARTKLDPRLGLVRSGKSIQRIHDIFYFYGMKINVEHIRILNLRNEQIFYLL